MVAVSASRRHNSDHTLRATMTRNSSDGCYILLCRTDFSLSDVWPVLSGGATEERSHGRAWQGAAAGTGDPPAGDPASRRAQAGRSGNLSSHGPRPSRDDRPAAVNARGGA